jgi:hypothetical protein
MPRGPVKKDDSPEKKSKKGAATKKATKKKEPKEKKKPTAYNVFMKKEMANIKAADANLAHKEVFKLAASRVSLLFLSSNSLDRFTLFTPNFRSIFVFIIHISFHFQWRTAPENVKNRPGGADAASDGDEE